MFLFLFFTKIILILLSTTKSIDLNNIGSEPRIKLVTYYINI